VKDLNIYSKTLNLMKEIMPDEFSFTIAYPLPGTKLYNLVDMVDDPDAEWEEPNENKLLFKVICLNLH